MSSHDPKIEQETVVDEVMVQSERWAERNYKTIIMAVIAATVLVLGGYAYYKLVHEPQAERASAEMYVAEEHFIAGQDSLALVGEGIGSKGFEAIKSEYSGTDAANLAQVYSGIALYDAGKYQEALEALKEFSSSERYVAPSVQRLMGDCYAQLGKLEDAASMYERAAKAADNDAISPSCLIKAGHVYEKLGKADKALEAYQMVKTKYYTAPEAQTIEADILRAEAAKK
ncbi:tetratricopeptide repeat protein [Porphyromonas sp. COT-239 OH1446]|uniref:tetratricopeptide repeat protein n=1 Tax=Porphyromonas sp. COT-239 OH1446 TaxID=1515613 RepID=UPI00052CECF8|nr:tetratricopeptide repeat protein [Porphyromonas sp. COT-239 OH1446]KGN68056.1 anaphase-promoting protein [Porphyromonas sp. COT-239 OH1446]